MGRNCLAIGAAELEQVNVASSIADRAHADESELLGYWRWCSFVPVCGHDVHTPSPALGGQPLPSAGKAFRIPEKCSADNTTSANFGAGWNRSRGLQRFLGLPAKRHDFLGHLAPGLMEKALLGFIRCRFRDADDRV